MISAPSSSSSLASSSSASSPVYSISVRGARARQDAKFALYPGTYLVYVLAVERSSGEGKLEIWEVTRRFSEIKKFWETLRPISIAAGATLSPFGGSSAFMTGTGYTGNLYETDPTSKFAEERIACVKFLMDELSTRVDAAGGQLFGLKMVKSFLEIEKHKQNAEEGEEAEGDASSSSSDSRDSEQPINDAVLSPSTSDEPRPESSRQELSILEKLTRTTPLSFITVFILVLALLLNTPDHLS